MLNIFFKVFETVLKNELVSALSDYISPFISAYREGYSTQYVLVRLIEELRKNKLKEILEFESKGAIEWFTRNGMFANPGKFKTFVNDKKQTAKRYKLAKKTSNCTIS